jgi:predicted metal-dependent hydrolase
MQLHNEGAFYEAHEAWESIWVHEPNTEWRVFLQGLIQITSAFHKLFVQRQSAGAVRLLERGLAKLDPYPADYLGVALGAFRDEAHDAALAIGALVNPDPERSESVPFDRARVPRLRLVRCP